MNSTQELIFKETKDSNGNVCYLTNGFLWDWDTVVEYILDNNALTIKWEYATRTVIQTVEEFKQELKDLDSLINEV